MDIAMYLNSLGVKIQFVAVGYNGAVVDKAEYHEIILKEGDVLEIVRPVGGGKGPTSTG